MHQPSGGIRGQASDIAIQAEQLIYIKRLMAERIAHHSGQTVEQIQHDSERDRWFTAEQAKDYGLIDHVIVKRGEMSLIVPAAASWRSAMRASAATSRGTSNSSATRSAVIGSSLVEPAHQLGQLARRDQATSRLAGGRWPPRAASWPRGQRVADAPLEVDQLVGQQGPALPPGGSGIDGDVVGRPASRCQTAPSGTSPNQISRRGWSAAAVHGFQPAIAVRSVRCRVGGAVRREEGPGPRRWRRRGCPRREGEPPRRTSGSASSRALRRSTVWSVRLRSPRSTPPTKVRWTSSTSASVSCERPRVLAELTHVASERSLQVAFHRSEGRILLLVGLQTHP